MADTKISEMTAASALTGTEVVPVLQSSTNKRTTAQAIANLAITGTITTNKILKAASSTTASDSTITDNGGVTIGSPTGGAQGAGSLNAEKLFIATSITPAGPTATGVAGQIGWDATYIYVCVATNTWIRCAKDVTWV